jgi:hypothetical protein
MEKQQSGLYTLKSLSELKPCLLASVESLVERRSGGMPLGWLKLVERACLAQGYEVIYHVLEDGARALGISFGVLLPGIGVKQGRALPGPLKLFVGMLPLSFGPSIFVEEKLRGSFLEPMLASLPKRRLPYVCMFLPHPENEADFETCIDGRFTKIPYYTGAQLPLAFGNFDEYLATLPSKWRHNIRNNMSFFEKSGCHFEPCTDPSRISDRLYELYKNVAIKNGRHASPFLLHPNCFEDLTALLPHEYRLILARKGAEIIGFSLMIKKLDALDLRFLGQDYGAARECALYFNLCYEGIRQGLRERVARIDLGITSAAVKRRMGCSFVQPYAYLGGSTRWLTRVMGWTGSLRPDRFTQHA